MRWQAWMLGLALAAMPLAVVRAVVPADARLYDFAAGTTIKAVKVLRGEPDKIFRFDDGWVAYAYQFPNHNLIVETNDEDVSRLSSVRVEGISNPPGMGLAGIDLGMPVGKALAAFGAPVDMRPAIDSVTRLEIPDTWLYAYPDASFEVKDGTITSMKLHFRTAPLPRLLGEATPRAAVALPQ